MSPEIFEEHVANEQEINLCCHKLKSRVFEICRKKNLGEKLEESLNEIIYGVKCLVLTVEQVAILLDKLEGATYDMIRKKYKISCDAVVERILMRTACGKAWKRKMKGGGEPIFSALDSFKLIRIVKERAEDINCLSTCEARAIIYNLQTARIQKAREILYQCNCQSLASKVRMRDPDSSWLSKMSQRSGISFMAPEQLETLRRM